MTAAELETSCTEAGETFEGEGAVVSCSAPIKPAGLNGRLEAKLCDDGTTCMIRVRDRGTDGGTAAVMKRVAGLEEALTERYGEPTSRQVDARPDCMEEVASTACLESGAAKVDLEWAAPAKPRIRLRTRVHEGTVFVELRYDKPETKLAL